MIRAPRKKIPNPVHLSHGEHAGAEIGIVAGALFLDVLFFELEARFLELVLFLAIV